MNGLQAWLWGLFVVSAATRIGWSVFFWWQLRLKKPKHSTGFPPTDCPSVSIVVCARNERFKLAANLNNWLEQTYPAGKLELVIVDDASTDGSLAFLRKKQTTEARMTVVSIDPDEKRAGKRHALERGAAAATGSILLLTDADCRPASSDWVSLMTRPFADVNKQIVLGLAPLTAPRDSWVGSWVQYETRLTALLYTSLARAGRPYMGVGRNLAYRRSFFLAKSRLNEHPAGQASGDDDLFVGRYATAANTAVQTNVSAYCYSPSPVTFRAWLRQKTRHLSTAKHYDPITLICLGLNSLPHQLFYYAGIGLLISGGRSGMVFAIYGTVVLIEYLSRRTTLVSVTGSRWLLFDFLHLLYYGFFILILPKPSKTSWN